MMKKIRFLNKKSFFVLLFISFAFSSFAKDWIIAATQFSTVEKQKNSVSLGISETLPQKILENLYSLSTRQILIEEEREREFYDLKNQRISLFLQLSNQIKTRDSLVVSVRDDKTLKKKILEQEEEIKKIKTKIDENLELRNQLMQGIYKEEIPFEDFISKKLYKKNNNLNVENLALYNNDSSSLYKPTADFNTIGKDSYEFEKEIVSKGICGLITGQINMYGEYLIVNVQLTNYPGGNEIYSCREYGHVSDLDDIAKTISLGMNNPLANSMPVVLKISGLSSEGKLYVDSQLMKGETKEGFTEYHLSSGVHFLEFVQENYNKTGISYYFEGNKNYHLEVQMEELISKEVVLKTRPYVPMSLYLQGEEWKQGEDNQFTVKINNEKILGQFITMDEVAADENGEMIVTKKGGAVHFFFIGEDSFAGMENPSYTVKVKALNTGDYIEKRRRWMYTSYSILVTSLIPNFYIRGQANSYRAANAAGYITTTEDWNKANNWILASNISTGVTIGCGVWFVYELIRYLYSTNSVLPSEAKLEN